MIEVMSLLASYGFFRGGDIGNILAQWQAAGIFSYVLPFLLIFALTFGLLIRIGLFTTKTKEGVEGPNKSINAIIALAVSLMALQFDFVSVFFSEIFPRFGVALSIILVIIILGGLFMPLGAKGFNWVLILVVMVIIGIVVFQSLGSFGYNVGSWWGNYGLSLIGWVVFLGLIIAVVAGSTSSSPNPDNLLNRILLPPRS
ncbi:hypothetical protein HYS72_00025 [Candidatus Pacearchaeota archaeon]|nr:hypothetical protein [Candidatus Pacearchaeota archaeon]MBI2056768.1 hypothetical protein [Candidatus Pacearchaeota archaeon]